MLALIDLRVCWFQYMCFMELSLYSSDSCLSKLRLNIVYIQGVAYEQFGSLIPTLDLTIQIIEFTFYT